MLLWRSHGRPASPHLYRKDASNKVNWCQANLRQCQRSQCLAQGKWRWQPHQTTAVWLRPHSLPTPPAREGHQLCSGEEAGLESTPPVPPSAHWWLVSLAGRPPSAAGCDRGVHRELTREEGCHPGRTCEPTPCALSPSDLQVRPPEHCPHYSSVSLILTIRTGHERQAADTAGSCW